jgi:hypothetical protein
MNRKKAAELWSFIKAFGEGKDIEIRSKNPHAQLNGWAKMDEFIFGNFEYRIKPEPKYRPFKDAEECWQEMMKHQPFGVVKDKYFANYQTHRAFTCLVTNGCHFRGYEDETFESCFKNLLFADGLPFGVKDE